MVMKGWAEKSEDWTLSKVAHYQCGCFVKLEKGWGESTETDYTCPFHPGEPLTKIVTTEEKIGGINGEDKGIGSGRGRGSKCMRKSPGVMRDNN